MTDDCGHIPVLGDPIREHLSPKKGQTFIDCTLGRGGHGETIIPLLSPGGCYVGFDLDAGNLDFARERLAPIAEKYNVTLHTVHANFAEARKQLGKLNIDRADALLADLGFASNQMDDPQRGFSFMGDGPLDMRLNPQQSTSAADIIARFDERELANLIYQLGEDPFSRRIARKIVEKRDESPITSTRQLAELVKQAYGPKARHSRMHPATRTFMALRIAVNGELDALDRLLYDLPRLLKQNGGRAGIISFHSLEDRRVKQAMQRYEQQNLGQRIIRKPVIASDEEMNHNPRSRSAKLRLFAFEADHTD